VLERLYTAPPEGGIVVCLDEMGPQSARSYPGRRVVKPAPPKAQRAKQEIDYGRRGKGYVFGAFRPATGEAFTAGLSQTLAWATRWAVPTQISRFVHRWQTETDRQQPVLLAYRPGTCEAEPLTQPQHGFETPDCPSRRVEGLKAADPRHRPLDPEDPMSVWLATCAPGE